MTNKKHLKFYYDCMRAGTMPTLGLCLSALDNEYIDSDLLELFNPTQEEIDELAANNMATGYWGSGLSVFDEKKYWAFTPLRQTIVLLMAAMNSEL